jgi:phage-related protein
MPGSVSNASPSTVLPLSLSTAFTHAREYAVNESAYIDGSSQRGRLSETSRKTWRMTKRLTVSELATLFAFYLARHGAHEAFYFYDPWASGFTHDPDGEQELGRYTVRFEGEWTQMMDIVRGDVELTLVELA